MNKILPALLAICLAGSVCAQTITEKYAPLGDLFIVKLDSAPFPHPDRAQGHKYHNDFYSAEKCYSDNSVAIFVPKGFRATDKTDFVIHFHGWRHHIENTFSEYNLAQQFVESERNAILIVPQGAKDTPDSFGGKLEDTNGFARFMGDVMSTLRDRGIVNTSEIGSIVLSGHSGGYQVIGSIVDHGGLSANVKEVLLFDALYARREQYMAWYMKYPNRRFLTIYTLHGGTKEEVETLMTWAKAQKPPIPFLKKNEADVTTDDLRNNNFIIIYSPLAHDEVMSKNNQFREILNTGELDPIKIYTSPKAAAER